MYGKCDRCNERIIITTGSYFNEEMICMECKEEEKAHKDYAYAKEVELHEVRVNKNYNYPGIYAGLTWDEIKEKQ